MNRIRLMIATVLSAMLLLAGAAMPASAQVEQDGLVNVLIGDVTILEEVDVALAANFVANVCALVKANVLVLAQGIDAGNPTDFSCDQRGSGRSVAITNN